MIKEENILFLSKNDIDLVIDFLGDEKVKKWFFDLACNLPYTSCYFYNGGGKKSKGHNTSRFWDGFSARPKSIPTSKITKFLEDELVASKNKMNLISDFEKLLLPIENASSDQITDYIEQIEDLNIMKIYEMLFDVQIKKSIIEDIKEKEKNNLINEYERKISVLIEENDRNKSEIELQNKIKNDELEKSNKRLLEENKELIAKCEELQKKFKDCESSIKDSVARTIKNILEKSIPIDSISEFFNNLNLRNYESIENYLISNIENLKKLVLIKDYNEYEKEILLQYVLIYFMRMGE